jgi:hypothetical protein
LENPDQEKGLSHADAFLAALNKKGSGVMLSRPPTPATAESTLPSERPVRAPSRRPSSVTVPPPVVGVGRGRIFAAIAAAIVFVLLFWSIAGRDDESSGSSEMVVKPEVKARVVEPEPVVVEESPAPMPTPTVKPLVVAKPMAAKPAVKVAMKADAGMDANATVEARFAELDAQLGVALEARGLGFEDLSAVEANRTRQWGRWFKKAERPTIEMLEATHAELLAAIDRAAPAKAAKAEPQKAPLMRLAPKKPALTEASRTSSSSKR